MSKSKAKSGLGRILIKSHSRSSRSKRIVGPQSMLHTTEIKDGYDWGRLNLQSVTEESSFQEFLATAELAGTEFQAEKLNLKFVSRKANVGLLSAEEKVKVKAKYEKYRELIRIPRRPKWDDNTAPEQLNELERDEFLKWRRSLAQVQENGDCLLTPFEKNLEFWRQLWRVVERSDVVVQIVDARNPLLFRCEDLEKYVKEVSREKENVILINKSDFLTESQRDRWANYFDSCGVRALFFSAVLIPEEMPILEELTQDAIGKLDTEPTISAINVSVQMLETEIEETAKNLKTVMEAIEKQGSHNTRLNSNEILSRTSLIQFFKTFFKGERVNPNHVTIGLVGYPNVGKSSTINSLLQEKKVSVSATPGKTKHFQTLYLEKDLLLCDCPGLVFPSFVYTKAEMIINGILSIDQMRDHVPPINVICQIIPRHIFEDTYGIMLPTPLSNEDSDRNCTWEELLNAHAYNRGFMTANGQPDNSRSARLILKDFVNGKLLYAYSPPNNEQNDYHFWPKRQKAVRPISEREYRAIKSSQVNSDEHTREYVASQMQKMHIKGFVSVNSGESWRAETDEEKPWRNRLKNKPRKDKLRRMYAHLDQH